MRHWFITGTSGGLGLALAEAVLARGDKVTGTVRNAAAAEALEALAPGRARAVLLDVTDLEEASRAVAEAGPIDVLVNNAGFSLEGVLEATSLPEIRLQLETLLIAPIALIQAALPAMRARRSGHILNIGSLAAHVEGGGVSIYASAKAAIEALSVALANEVKPFGIGVTAVVPGAFRTALGTSRHSASARIDDYAEADEARRAWFATFSNTQRGDPAKAAGAILALVDLDEPPLRFALGPDAIEGMRGHAAAMIRDADRWEYLGGATDL